MERCTPEEESQIFDAINETLQNTKKNEERNGTILSGFERFESKELSSELCYKLSALFKEFGFQSVTFHVQREGVSGVYIKARDRQPLKQTA